MDAEARAGISSVKQVEKRTSGLKSVPPASLGIHKIIPLARISVCPSRRAPSAYQELAKGKGLEYQEERDSQHILMILRNTMYIYWRMYMITI
jgi:hypothetical protein